MTAFDDLIQRVADLEAATITVSDLPMASIQRSLEMNWQPDAGTLLGDSAIGRDQMVQKFDVGTSVATWAASTDSNFLDVPHALGVVPTGVVFGSEGAFIDYLWFSSTSTATTIRIQGRAAAVFTGTKTVSWLAFL